MSPRAVRDTRGKALDLWIAPPDAGEPLVCIATSFTFDATFFETECVGRFLQMDSHPSESDAVAYLVEREEKLAAAKVCALVDRRHAREKESFRWDIIGVLVPRAIQHAKMSLLVWGGHARLIVGSGNLTEPGYRSNLEVFGFLDISREEGGDRTSFLTAMDFLESIIERGVGDDGEATPKGRAIAGLTAARRRIAQWDDVPSRGGPSLILGAPGRSALTHMMERWPAGGPPRKAIIVSPFFDPPGKSPSTVNALAEKLAQRGHAELVFQVRGETIPGDQRRIFMPREAVVAAEESCKEVRVQQVTLVQDGDVRMLHAKLLRLENESWCLVMAGSSNFTAAGLTAATGGSFEANLLYRYGVGEAEHKRLDEFWPEVVDEVLGSDADVVWDAEPEELEDGSGDSVPLPECFHEALFLPGKEPRLRVELKDGLPKRWSIASEEGEVILSSRSKPSSGTHEVSWTNAAPPFVLTVSWEGETGTLVANWPVNVSNSAALPPPEALRDLSLEELIAILASSRPLSEAVVAVLRKRRRRGTASAEVLDPLKRLDSPTYLLRRTKRVAAALERLRERLERPALSRESFEWRLNGAIGPIALADAFVREAALDGEARFYLAELALTLSRVSAAKAAMGGLSRDRVADMLTVAIAALKQRAGELPTTSGTEQLNKYVAASFREAVRK
jgi:hypothetical protein